MYYPVLPLKMPKKKPKDPTAVSRRARKRLSPAELAQLQRYKAMLKPGALGPEKAGAMQTLAGLMEKGRLGPGSELLLKRTRTGKAIAALTERSDRGAGYLSDLGAWGVLAHALGITTIARAHAYRKRRDVLKAVEAYVKAQPDSFKTIVFAVARFLHQNHGLRHTAVYDPKAEGAIYELFGRLAEKNREYSKKFPHPEKQAIKDYGQQYFRSIVRNGLLSDFLFLQRQHANPDKMAALRYALVGGTVDPLTETRDRNRILFIQDIFAKDVPELNRAGAGKGMMARALQALIRIRARAMNGLGTRDTVDFYYQVCNYYKIKPSEVDRYALDIYWGLANVARPTKPKITGERAITQEGLMAMEEHEKAMRTAAAREKELKERILQIYGKDALEKYRPNKGMPPNPGERPTPAIMLPPGGITFRPPRK